MFRFEYTDTFAGEANYSWVKREVVQLPENISDRSLVRAAKAWAGLNGVPCDTDNYGDTIAIRPRNITTVLFVTWEG